ncbi:ionotropic receptor 21a-like [Panulirus ornatus]|uniref:ionotropic receptor 21a-like n=1 Tax=Panulirus ornatus TaxID=150431 RepID=UPI003A88733D
MIQEAFGTLLGQNLSKWLPRASSSRVLVASWLVFAFILGTVYRGNLTAALTLPKYPPRPETVEELVNFADRVTMPPFGKDWQKQFRESGSAKLERLANLMDIGPTILEGLQMALEKKQAHLTTRQAFSHWTAEHFTRADGSVPLYFGQEHIVPGACAWPIPHDAPYKHHVDNIMMEVKEAGLYDKWAEDLLKETRRESRVKRKEERGKDDTSSTTINPTRALTIVHMQGPLMLLLLGLLIAIITLISEILTSRCCH